MKDLIIVGGGTAGWFAAGWLSKKHKDLNITVVESPNIPKIGVGESVTPHVALFFDYLGLPWQQWMNETGAIYKYANKFVDWKTGNGEYEYFSFAPNFDTKLMHKDTSQPMMKEDWKVDLSRNRITDVILDLNTSNDFTRFDQYFDSQYHYMEKNTAPFKDKEYLLNPLFSWSQHINADLAADFIRDKIALPNGVTHIHDNVVDVISKNGKVDSIVLASGNNLTADFYLDASGFNRVLISKLGWEEKEYTDNPVDSAWVCQLDYEDPETEMVNYTQSIAKKHGWLFKIGLYHRMGTGYCFSSQHVSDEQALEDYLEMIGPNALRKEPRLIKWKPSRLEQVAKDNVAAVGLSSGFVEPMEANALYIIINSIQLFSKAIGNDLDFTELNEKMTYALDDIADFIKVHYTLSQRNDSNFWRDMRALGKKDNHVDLLRQKYINEKNLMINAISGYSLFPDYMWAQLAHAWDIDTSTWYKKPTELDLELTKINLTAQEAKHNLVSSVSKNNYQWLKENIFNNLTHSEWSKIQGL
jgi:flavin-dependent dehydrogenase